MEQNFRLLEVADIQVLIMKDFDEEENVSPYNIKVIFFIDGMKATHKYYYKKVAKRNEMFDSVDAKTLSTIVENAKKLAD